MGEQQPGRRFLLETERRRPLRTRRLIQAGTTRRHFTTSRRFPARRRHPAGLLGSDPSLTREKCSFWYFRFDADLGKRLTALLGWLKDDRRIQRVYLINQNYCFGQQFSRLARERLSRLRPDIEIVGNDLIPIGRVKDFGPYADLYVSMMDRAGTEEVELDIEGSGYGFRTVTKLPAAAVSEPADCRMSRPVSR